MAAIACPDEEESYLFALLTDPTGLDQAEFAWHDAENIKTGCYRAWDFQWQWYTCKDAFQADQGGRATGKTVGITMRAFRFPFVFEGQQMLLTAPELNHLKPLTTAIEKRLDNCRLIREMRPKTKGGGITKAPHWQCMFNNGAMIVSRLPNKDGKGVKGQHVIEIELDEAQDYPQAGWQEIGPTLNRGLPGAGWRVHGVPTGVRTRFYDITEGQQGDDKQWTVHRPMGFMRPSWTDEERQSYVDEYKSRQSLDYKRNIYGEHGDASNAVFVLAKLMACVDTDPSSYYNNEVYTQYQIEFETLPNTQGLDPEQADFIRQEALRTMIVAPATHFDGWSYRKGNKEVGAPAGYVSYWGGMDIGGTNHPSEILIYGQRKTSDQMDLLLRVNLQRISIDDQVAVVKHVIGTYGPDRVQAFGVDATGMGFQAADHLERYYPNKVYGYNFSEKKVVGFEDRELEFGETMEDIAIMRNVVEASTDWLRNDWVDQNKMLLPYDGELLQEWQGQTYTIVKDDRNPYLTKRQFGGGSFHTLDAGKLVMAARYIPPLEAILNKPPDQPAVLDYFVTGF
jgi:hypothetical protein